MRSTCFLALILVASWSLRLAVVADDKATVVGEGRTSNEAVDFFERRIRPALIEHCYGCHSADTDSSGGLLVDSRPGLVAGGDSGPSLLPGKSAASLLFRAISYEDPNLKMPPEGKLPDDVVADFQKWIDDGAIDPRDGSAAKQSRTTALSVENAQQHWAYRPLPSPDAFEIGFNLPPGRAVDEWIERELAKYNRASAGRAEYAALVRRLYFDLTGLPPTPEQLDVDLNDPSEDRYDRLVERLLASPNYGETFARRWMDVVRYADSMTLRGFILPQAWRYRDYLIDSFNRDRSVQTMIREQIAGDLMTSDNLRERNHQLIATTFLALGNTNLEQQDKTQLEMDHLAAR